MRPTYVQRPTSTQLNTVYNSDAPAKLLRKASVQEYDVFSYAQSKIPWTVLTKDSKHVNKVKPAQRELASDTAVRISSKIITHKMPYGNDTEAALNNSCGRYYQWLKILVVFTTNDQALHHTCRWFCISGVRNVSECFAAVVFRLSFSGIPSKHVCTHSFCWS